MNVRKLAIPLLLTLMLELTLCAKAQSAELLSGDLLTEKSKKYLHEKLVMKDQTLPLEYAEEYLLFLHDPAKIAVNESFKHFKLSNKNLAYWVKHLLEIDAHETLFLCLQSTSNSVVNYALEHIHHQSMNYDEKFIRSHLSYVTLRYVECEPEKKAENNKATSKDALLITSLHYKNVLDVFTNKMQTSNFGNDLNKKQQYENKFGFAVE